MLLLRISVAATFVLIVASRTGSSSIHPLFLGALLVSLCLTIGFLTPYLSFVACVYALVNRSARVAPGLLILHISGQITEKDVDLVRRLLEQERGVVAIDLKDVLLVDRDAIRLLALSELNGAELRNCPACIREWVTRATPVINVPEQGIEVGEDTEGA